MPQGTAVAEDAPIDNRNDGITRFQPGDVLLNRFRIVRLLGTGGMGEVYEATDHHLQSHKIALKVLSSVWMDGSEAEARATSEVLLARRVRHPNVCAVYDLFYIGDAPRRHCLLTMCLLQGETLAARLRREGRLPDEEAACIAGQIASGLRAAHQENVVHGDLKPGNIMLSGSGSSISATVMDFGLARHLRPEAGERPLNAVWGTPGYGAPEITKSGTVTVASDIYSFGVVVHEIYTGVRPDVCETQPLGKSGLKDVARPIRQLIRGCLEFDPAQRIQAFRRAIEIFESRHASRVPGHAISRRAWLAAGAAVISTGSGWWYSDDLAGLLQPLPLKRFVAVISWPAPADGRLGLLLRGALDAVAIHLARAERTDRDLLIIGPREMDPHMLGETLIKTCCDSVGANLALAASGFAIPGAYKIALKLLDASSNATLRERHLKIDSSEIATLTGKLEQAAAKLLGLSRAEPPSTAGEGTSSADAYQSFQQARSDFSKLNDAGLDAAIESYGKAVAADPRYVDAYGELARAYTRKFAATGNPAYLDLARANASAALRLDRNSVNALIASAEIMEDQGHAGQALQEISRALALDPENFRTLNAEAEIYTGLNRFAEAEATYRRVLDLRPNYWLTYNRLGSLLASQGKYQEGLKQFNLAKLLAPRSAVVLNNVGAVAMKLGLVKDAESSFLSATGIKPSDTTYCNLSQLAIAQHKFHQALEYALKATGMHGPADHLNWCQLGDCYQQMKGRAQLAQAAYAKALTEVKRRLQIDSTDGLCWMSQALYEWKLSNRADPTPLLEKAERLGATDIDSQMVKVRILELSNHRSQALATLTQCFKLGATPFEVTLVPDLDALRRDPAYARCEAIAFTGTKI